MRRAERTLLLLCGALDDGLAPLTPREYRILRLRVTQAGAPAENQLTERYLRSLGSVSYTHLTLPTITMV